MKYLPSRCDLRPLENVRSANGRFLAFALRGGYGGDVTTFAAASHPFGTIAFEPDPVRWMEGTPAYERPQQQRSRDALCRIVTSAVRLFSDNGLEATRVADIVRHAHVPTGTFYQHFADKEALLEAIFIGFRDCRMREIAALCTSPRALEASPRALVEMHLDIVFSSFTVDSGLLRLIERRRLEDPAMHRAQSRANEEVAGMIADLMVAKLPGRDPQELRQQVLYVHSIIRGAVVWSVLPRDGEAGEGLKVTDAGFATEALRMSLRYLGIDE